MNVSTYTEAVMTKVVFTLVHGTFAKGADWVVHEKSETFCSTLRNKLNQENTTSAPFGAEPLRLRG